jgi:hypothetical protein
MNQKIDIKEMEKKAYISYHQDGIVDIFAASYVIVFGAMMILDLPWIGGIVAIFGTIFYIAAKRAVTLPRIGFVKFKNRKPRMFLVSGIIVGASLFLLVVLMMRQFEALYPLRTFLEKYFLIVAGISGAVVCSLCGYAFGISRFYAYGLSSLAIFVVGYAFNISFPQLVTVLGFLLLFSGSALLARFAAKYPIKHGAVKDETEY